jgi:hypothetical protein
MQWKMRGAEGGERVEKGEENRREDNDRRGSCGSFNILRDLN